jgi:hypothetical protein
MIEEEEENDYDQYENEVQNNLNEINSQLEDIFNQASEMSQYSSEEQIIEFITKELSRLEFEYDSLVSFEMIQMVDQNQI